VDVGTRDYETIRKSFRDDEQAKAALEAMPQFHELEKRIADQDVGAARMLESLWARLFADFAQDPYTDEGWDALNRIKGVLDGADRQGDRCIPASLVQKVPETVPNLIAGARKHPPDGRLRSCLPWALLRRLAPYSSAAVSSASELILQGDHCATEEVKTVGADCTRTNGLANAATRRILY
jgi:hypothetical protein